MKYEKIRRNVYLPNKGAHDYSPANSFGKFVTMTEGPIKLTEPGYLVRIMNRILQDSNKDDYILLCGPTLANVIAVAIFARLHGRINLLIFRAGKAGPRYYERTILLEDFLDDKT